MGLYIAHRWVRARDRERERETRSRVACCVCMVQCACGTHCVLYMMCCEVKWMARAQQHIRNAVNVCVYLRVVL